MKKLKRKNDDISFFLDRFVTFLLYSLKCFFSLLYLIFNNFIIKIKNLYKLFFILV